MPAMLRRCLFLALVWTIASAAEPIPVVTGSSVVHEFTVRIGGDRISATCLVPAGQDSHGYQPRPDDVRALAAAKVAVVNGLGFEGWFDRLLRDSRSAPTVITAARGVDLIILTEHDDHPGHAGHAHAAGAADPHAWHDARNAARYGINIRDGLIAADPAGAAGYRERAATLVRECEALDVWIRAEVATLPAAKRILVTDHDGLRYFARAYGFEVHAPVGTLDDSEPGAKAVAALIKLVRSQDVPALFLESLRNPRLIERIAAESGARIGGTLYVDGLPDPTAGAGKSGGPVGYLATMRHNVTTIVTGLTSKQASP